MLDSTFSPLSALVQPSVTLFDFDCKLFAITGKSRRCSVILIELIVGEGKFGIGTSIRMIFDGKPGFVIGE
jgi:hypothetical protein